MAGEAALSPSQVKQDGQWRPMRHKTPLIPRPYPPSPLTRRLFPVTAKLKQRTSLSTIKESPVPSLKSNSSISLGLKTPLPPAWIHSSEHLIYIHPSHQLLKCQDASSASGFYDTSASTRGNLRTLDQRRAKPPASYVSSGIPVPGESSTVRTSATSGPDIKDSQEPEEYLAPVSGDLPREAIADLFHRVEEYEREQPDKIKDAGKVWVRVSEVGRDLTKTLKTMGSLRRKSAFEARLERDSSFVPPTPFRNVPVRSQVRIYEKPTRMKRMNIKVNDCWRRFRNWSTGEDTELQASNNVIDYQTMNVSIVSFNLNELNDTSVPQPQARPRKLSKAPQSMKRRDGVLRTRSVRRDSKFSIDELVGRRTPSLFPDADNGYVAVEVARGSAHSSARSTYNVNHGW